MRKYIRLRTYRNRNCRAAGALDEQQEILRNELLKTLWRLTSRDFLWFRINLIKPTTFFTKISKQKFFAYE